MVVRVANVCVETAGQDNVIVSTPDNEIRDACMASGINVVSSSPDCSTGTDRLAEYGQTHDFSRYVNVQGDEPMLTREVLKSFLDSSLQLPESALGVTEFDEGSMASDPNIVKVAESSGEILYASRAPIVSASTEAKPQFVRHTGLYCFTPQDLELYSQNRRGPLEKVENVEILRLIENRRKVSAVWVPNYGLSVDTLDDYNRVIQGEQIA